MNDATKETALPAIGSKFLQGRDIAPIAKLVRADIAAAIKAGVLPAGLKTSVTVSRYSMGHSIRVEVKAAPGVCFLSIARILVDMKTPNAWPLPSWMSADGAAIEKKLSAILNAYNRAGERAYFQPDVAFATELSIALRAEITAAIIGSQVAA